VSFDRGQFIHAVSAEAQIGAPRGLRGERAERVATADSQVPRLRYLEVLSLHFTLSGYRRVTIDSSLL
jgi:hypothetical protein